nr:reverse transcriptase domain-containing protein [Tanacetum cinerariifolium]
MKEQIEGHVSALKSLIKSHNQRNKGDPIRLDFESKDTEVQDMGIAKGKEVMDEDLGKPFKEARRTTITCRIIEFAGPEYKMPDNIKLYDGTTDPEDHLSRFVSTANLVEWPMPVWCRMFQQTLDGSARGWLDDFIRFEEAYARTKLLKGEVGETHRKTSLPFNRMGKRLYLNTHPRESRRNEYRSNYRNRRDAYLANRTRDDRAPYLPSRGEYNHRVTPVLTLESLTKRPKEILATETQLHLPAPPKKAVGDGIRVGIIKLLCEGCTIEGKGTPRQEGPPTSKGDQCDPANILEGRFRGTFDCRSEGGRILVRRVYVDEGSSVEVMFEHCFENLDPRIKAKLKETQTNLVEFVEEISKPFGKIELNVCFGNGGRHGLKSLRAIPSTIHLMMKFPTPKGVATLVTQTIIIAECRRLEKKQMIEESFEGEREDTVIFKLKAKLKSFSGDVKERKEKVLVITAPKEQLNKLKGKVITKSERTTVATSPSPNTDSNTPVLSSTGVNLVSSASGSKSQDNTKKNRIQRTQKKAKETELEDHLRTVKSS